MDLLSYVRSAVSKDKIRFRDGQYDLVRGACLLRERRKVIIVC